MTGFLTQADIEFMTELRQPAAQIRWLQKWGIRHTVSAAGNPRVTWEAVNSPSERVSGGEWTPDLSLLDRAG